MLKKITSITALGGIIGLLLATLSLPWLVPSPASAGTNTLTSVSGGKVQTSHVNQYYSALNQDFVPRNSSGVPTDNAGDVGSSTHRWNQGFFYDNVVIGSTGAVTLSHNSAANNDGLMSNGGVNGLFFPNGSSAAALDGGFGSRTLGIRTSGSSQAYPIVVSHLSNTHGLKIITGTVGTAASGSGSGWTYTKSSTGVYGVNFTTSFSSTPVVILQTWDIVPTNVVYGVTLTSKGVGSFSYFIYNAARNGTDVNVDFIAIGERPN